MTTKLPSPTILITPRLFLRPLQWGDEVALEGVFGDAEVMRFGDGVQNAAWIKAWLANQLANDASLTGIRVWGGVEQETAELIGYCGLFFMANVNGREEVEIGYRLARPFWGQGYATEAATAVRDYAFDTLHLPRLIALIDPSNVASMGVAEKLGMVREAEVLLPGYTHPDWVYALSHNPHPSPLPKGEGANPPLLRERG